MLRHFRNKHGTSQPYPQNHRAYPPPPPPPPPPPSPSPIQTTKQSWISTAATTTTATSEVENEFRFQHPFTANITGPAGCGKTYFVKALLLPVLERPTAKTSASLLTSALISACAGLVLIDWKTGIPCLGFTKGLVFSMRQTEAGLTGLT